MLKTIKDTIEDAYLDMCLDEVVDDEPYQIRIKKEFDTACWTYKDKHIIFVGDTILHKLDNGKNIEDVSEYDEYIASYLYHEVGHSLFTTRDLKTINYALNTNKIPFSIFNLAEDARIEHLMRVKTSRLFNWTQYEKEIPPISPLEILFYIVQQDGSLEGVPETDDAQKVIVYYERFCKALDSIEVVEILIEWAQDFEMQDDAQQLQDKLEEDESGDADDSSESEGASDKSKSIRALEDLKHTLELEDDEAFEAAINESDDIQDDEPEATMPGSEKGELNSTFVSEHTNGVISSEDSAYWDSQKAQILSEKFLPIFKEKTGYKVSRRPSRKMNTKAFRPFSCTDKYYKRQTREQNSTKTITIMLDCSGSMYRAIIDMRVVIGVFNELAKMHKIEGNIILSAIDQGIAKCETYKFPVEDEVIGKFSADYSGEGIELNMKNNISFLQESDHIFVLTDGHITDNKIEKEFYNSKGLFTTGIYIGNPEDCYLNNWFDKGIAVETVEDCVDSLVSHLKRNLNV